MSGRSRSSARKLGTRVVQPHTRNVRQVGGNLQAFQVGQRQDAGARNQQRAFERAETVDVEQVGIEFWQESGAAGAFRHPDDPELLGAVRQRFGLLEEVLHRQRQPGAVAGQTAGIGGGAVEYAGEDVLELAERIERNRQPEQSGEVLIGLAVAGFRFFRRPGAQGFRLFAETEGADLIQRAAEPIPAHVEMVGRTVADEHRFQHRRDGRCRAGVQLDAMVGEELHGQCW